MCMCGKTAYQHSAEKASQDYRAIARTFPIGSVERLSFLRDALRTYVEYRYDGRARYRLIQSRNGETVVRLSPK